MRQIIPKDSRYIPFTQQKSCCVSTCISMIMYRHGIPLVPQEFLGYYLGLIVAKENKHLFWNVRTGERPHSGWGTQASKKQYDINKAFRKLHISLKATSLLISEFDNASFRKYLNEIETLDKDVLVCFDHRVLNKQRKTRRGEHQGHMCLIDRIDLKNNKVRLVDPSANQPKWRLVSIPELKKAMAWHDEQSAGFYEFEVIGKKKK